MSYGLALLGAGSYVDVLASDSMLNSRNATKAYYLDWLAAITNHVAQNDLPA